MNRLPINIWDDYYEDGYVPDGSTQETYMYVEDIDIPMLLRKCTLEFIMDYMKNILKITEFEMKLSFYDSKLIYPQLVGTENESLLFERWEIRLCNLTHKRRYKLVEELNNAKLEFNNMPIEVYSES